MSSSFQRVGRHMRGDWLNTWIASHPRSTPRSWAFTRPPAVETWAPISTARDPSEQVQRRPAVSMDVARKACLLLVMLGLAVPGTASAYEVGAATRDITPAGVVNLGGFG